MPFGKPPASVDMPLWKNADGILIANESGILINCAECPCSLDIYSVTFDLTKTAPGGTAYRYFGTVNFPRVSASHWQDDLTVGYQPDGGTETTGFVRLNIILIGSDWEFNVGFSVPAVTAYAEKIGGITPDGAYAPKPDTTGTCAVS